MTQSDTPFSAADYDVTDAAHKLISSARVEGTPVYDRLGEPTGSIHSVMIDKFTGQVAYAVLTFGGIFGFGERAYLLPWSMMRYDKEMNGYCIDERKEAIEATPYMTLDHTDRPQFTDEPLYRHWDEYL